MRTRVWLGVAVAAAAVGAGAGFLLGRHGGPSPGALPVLGTAPSYTLTDQLGRSVSSDRFAGKVQLVTFLSPYCTGSCPLIAYNLISLERVLEAAGLASRVQLVAFDVDPGHTGPAAMAAFLRQYGWDPSDPRWEFLTGTPEAVRAVVTGGFAIDYERVTGAQEAAEDAAARREGRFVPEPQVANPLATKADPDYDVVHNDALVVVDPEGRIRAFFDEAARLSNSQLMAVITRLVPDPGGG